MVGHHTNFESGFAWRFSDETLALSTQDQFDQLEMTLASYDLREILQGGIGPDEIADLIHTFVAPNEWSGNGGDLAQLQIVGTRLFIDAPARMHERAQWILGELAVDGKLAGRAPASNDPFAAASPPVPGRGTSWRRSPGATGGGPGMGGAPGGGGGIGLGGGGGAGGQVREPALEELESVDPELASLRRQVREHRLRLVQLGEKYAPSHSIYRSTEKELDVLNGLIITRSKEARSKWRTMGGPGGSEGGGISGGRGGAGGSGGGGSNGDG